MFNPGMNFVSHPHATKVVTDQLVKAGLTGRSGEIIEAFQGLFRQKPASPLFTWRERRVLRHQTYGEFQQAVIALKDRLLDLGIAPGDRVVILSESRPEWCQSFLSISIAGGIAVPLDTRLSPVEMQTLAKHADPKFIIFSDECRELAEKLECPKAQGIGMSDFDGVGLLALRNPVPGHRHPVKERELEDVTLIAYTSGTSGNPKGVMLTIRNIWFEVTSLSILFGSRPNDVMLSMLPLNHLLELAGGYLSALMVGARIVFAGSYLPNELLEWMQTEKVTRMITVPLFLEQLRKSIERELSKKSAVKRFLFNMLCKISPIFPTCFRRRLLFPAISKKFGGKLRLFICGGAPLSADTARFFDRLGIRVCQGYGLTETSPVITVNRLEKNRYGSVGVPLDTVRVRIEENGEIVVKGPNVMKGYFRNPTATSEVLTGDGWFRTGDVGRVDDDGFLWITGRVKSVVVLAGGKKVFLEELDDPLSRSAHFLEACAMGVRSQGVGNQITERVLVVVRPFNQEAGLEEVEHQVRQCLADVATYKHPAEVRILLREFPRTATRKIKKHELEKYLNE